MESGMFDVVFWLMSYTKAGIQSMWFPIIMLGWGVVMTLTGLVKDFNGLVIARVFLGITESGLFPVGHIVKRNHFEADNDLQFRESITISPYSRPPPLLELSEVFWPVESTR